MNVKNSLEGRYYRSFWLFVLWLFWTTSLFRKFCFCLCGLGAMDNGWKWGLGCCATHDLQCLLNYSIVFFLEGHLLRCIYLGIIILVFFFFGPCFLFIHIPRSFYFHSATYR